MNLLKQEENGILCVTMDDRFEKYMAVVEDRQKGGYYANVSIFNEDKLSGVVTLPGLLAVEKQQDGKMQMLDVKGRRQKRRQIVCQVPESLIYQGSGA